MSFEFRASSRGEKMIEHNIFRQDYCSGGLKCFPYYIFGKHLLFTSHKNTTMKSLLMLLLILVSLSCFAQTNRLAQKVTDVTLNGFPVKKSFVRTDVIDRAKKEYGSALYSIEKSQGPNCLDSYLVGLIHNGKLSMEWMCADPKIAMKEQSSGFFLASK
jgi:hypothetical protein